MYNPERLETLGTRHRIKASKAHNTENC
jgi:hypothetical protein